MLMSDDIIDTLGDLIIVLLFGNLIDDIFHNWLMYANVLRFNKLYLLG